MVKKNRDEGRKKDKKGAPRPGKTLPTEPRAEDLENAKKLIDDPEATVGAVDETRSKADRVKQALGEAYDVVCAFARLVLAYVRGEYRDVSLRTILLILAALAYFLSPFDVIPDFILVLGYTDDVALLLATAKSCKTEIDAFLAWEKGCKAAETAAVRR